MSEDTIGRVAGRLPDYLPFVAAHRSVTSRRKASQSHHSHEAIFLKGSIR